MSDKAMFGSRKGYGGHMSHSWLKRSAMTFAGMVVGWSPVVAAAASVQLPKLRQGEAYAHARGELIHDGWKPVKTQERLGDGTLAKTFGDAGEMVSNGYTETFDCSGTGLNYCTFVWKRGQTCIHVQTQGEYVPERGSPKVYRVMFGNCAGPK